MKRLLLLGLVLLLVASSVVAHEGLELTGMDEEFKKNSLWLAGISSVIVAAAILVAEKRKKMSEKLKWALFIIITIPVVVSTIYIAGSTIYLNVTSETKGPVHWHADFEIWNCGEKIDLLNPSGVLNRIGSPVFHEHGDDRMHVEGVVVQTPEVDLHNFFSTIGGELGPDYINLPTETGIVNLNNGQQCNGKEGKLQIFIMRVINPDPRINTGFEYEQFKADENYILSSYSNVPPADCIIIEFDEEKESTDKICETYKIAIEKGRMSRGG